ncbi:hypothetical protein SAMN05446037_103616 [Anaerovirgula multivorans]|uniref:Uncharacterized protein n=1 Tax=Anaerovirgula multivorans TaxID=312168 RepID=A0A239JIV0_9FIRM|nr:hypothetical protein [Anaerovirgula multivorans]SNT05760.1 hypothetical protein SAMN05446037_103616 [Anaerovirgula multivorans]
MLRPLPGGAYKVTEAMIKDLIVIHVGEDEMKTLNEGVLRVIRGEEEFKIYEKEVKIND